MKPRNYQVATVDAIFDYWFKGPQVPDKPWGHPIAALPTGTGKSIIIAEFIRRAVAIQPGVQILVLQHVKELIGQNFSKLLEIMPTANAGIYSAGLRRKDVGRSITFAGIGSIARAIKLFSPDIIIIDECHTVSPHDSTTYRKVIASCLERKPNCKIVGLSATPFRIGQGMLVEPGGIFTDICFDLTGRDAFNWFISEGYLKPLTPYETETQYDISSVKIASNGDYNPKQLQEAVDKEVLTRAAVAEMIRKASDRDHWLVFAAGIQHAEHVAAILVENGISAVCIHSKSSDTERDEGVEMFKAGEVRALVNNGCFTTGFDFPGIDYISILRHTTSVGLWIQMLGRGTRPDWLAGFDLSTREGRLACIAAGRPNCLVSDFAKNTARLGEINNPKIPTKKKKSETPGDAPAKACEKCLAYNFASARICCQCGAEFVFKIKLETVASKRELIAGAKESENQEPVEEWFAVETVTYSKHVPWNAKKRSMRGSPIPSLRVTYNCEGMRAFSEYHCFEHEGHAQASAAQWWREVSLAPVPVSVEDALALADNLKQPTRLRVWINRPNPRIQYREFSA